MINNYNLQIAEYPLAGSGPLSLSAINLGFCRFGDLLQAIKALPYGRNTHRDVFNEVLLEQRGTCSTKHGFIKTIAVEQDLQEVLLKSCIFKMNAVNTPNVEKVLQKYDMTFIPELHCYLDIVGQAVDCTFHDSQFADIEKDIMYTMDILPSFLSTEKVIFHKKYLTDWIIAEKIPFTLDQLWSIREECIEQLSL